MKQVLIIDESPLFREYLRAKFEENSVSVSFGNNPREGIAKMRSIVPDLVILDFNIDQRGFIELFKQKKNHVNTANIPVVIFTQHIEQRQLIELASYNIKKIFTKPVKIDALFLTLSEILGINFDIDKSPGIVEANVNEDILFIEIAQGLNRDKLELLHYKIRELLDIYKIFIPKILIMFSNIELGAAEAPKLSKLFYIVLHIPRIKQDNIRVLANDDYVRMFLGARKEYSNIIVVSSLQSALDDLIPEADRNTIRSELFGGKMLQAKTREADEVMPLKFDTDTRSNNLELIRNLGRSLRIAVIDDDFFFQELIKAIFRETGATITSFLDGEEFLMAIDTWDFDLAFLDLNMPKVDGFEVLKALQARDTRYPIIVLSAVSQQETIIKVIQMGVKSYLVKPLKPEEVFKKSIEILKANF